MTSTQDEQLRECPFCGSTKEIGLDSLGLAAFDITCWKCRAGTGISYGPEAHSEEAAIAAWNKRASLPSPDTATPCKHCGKGPRAYTHEPFDDSEHEYESQAPDTAGEVRLMERFNAFLEIVKTFEPEKVALLEFGPEVKRLLERLAAPQAPATGGIDWRSECEWLLDLDEIHLGEEETEVLDRIARIRATLTGGAEGGV